MTRYLIEYAGKIGGGSYGFEPREAPLADTFHDAASEVFDHLSSNHRDDFVKAVRVTAICTDCGAEDVTAEVLQAAAAMLADKYGVHQLLLPYAPDWIKDFWAVESRGCAEAHAMAAE